ncbi:hypothetical protein Dimus_035841, partial [Dionaea muscipula]
MVGRSYSQRRAEDIGCDPRSPDRFPVLGRGSPSPRPTHFRRPPSSPGIRPHRHRSPSPMVLNSSDPDDFDSSEEGDPSEAVVTSSEADEPSDLDEGKMISTHVFELRPIVEDFGMPADSVSPDSGSPVLSPVAAVRYCQATTDACGLDMVSSRPSFSLGAVVSGGHRDGAMVDPQVAVVRLCQADSEACGDDLVWSPNSSRLGELIRGQRGDGAAMGVVQVFDSGCVEDAAMDVGGGDVEIGSAPCVSECVDGDVLLPIGAYRDALCTAMETICPCPSSSTCIAVTNVGGGVVIDAIQTMDTVRLRAAPLLSNISGGDVGFGGTVSEEVRVATVAREALRSQPTDGLRQPPSSQRYPRVELRVELGWL